MALSVSSRLCGRNLLGCHILRNISVYQSRQYPLQSRPATEPVEEGHDERNMRLCRPMSPHITIYKFELPAILSISHRITGLVLSGYAGTFAVVSLLSNKSMGEIVQNISYCYPNFFLLFKVGLIFPFAYHFFNGIRHLVWDGGKSLTLKGVYTSGYLMLTVAGVSALALCFKWIGAQSSLGTYALESRPVFPNVEPTPHRIWDTGKALTLKGVYISGYTMLLFAFASFGALFYLAEEQKRLEKERQEAERKRKAELEAKKAAEEAEKNKNKKKKKK